jgi:hypothetical protein
MLKNFMVIQSLGQRAGGAIVTIIINSNNNQQLSHLSLSLSLTLS